MFNFSGLGYKSLPGRLVRLPLRLLPASMAMPVWQGPLRGKKWIVGSSTHGCWLGNYEADKQSLVAGLVKPGSVFFDVGAHVGFYTLLASVLVQDNGSVFAFEPFPRNIAFLEKHLALNSAKNVTLFKAAVGDQPGEARFQEGHASTMGKVSDDGTIVVELVALDDLLNRQIVPMPDYMKIDVEGAELHVLKGARHILTAGHPIIFLATHGAQVHKDCLALLRSLGYTCESLVPKSDVESCDEIMARRWRHKRHRQRLSRTSTRTSCRT